MTDTIFEGERVEAKQENKSIVSLFGKEKLEEIQDKISKATGLAFVTVDYKGEPVTETTGFTPFCKAVREGERSCECCKRSDAFGALQAVISRKPSIYFCPCGLLEVAIPIEDQGVFLGGFIGGQIRCDDAPDDVTRLEQLFKQDANLKDSDTMITLKNQVRSYSYQQFTDVVNLIHMIINQMCEAESDHVKDTGKIWSKVQRLEEQKEKLKFEIEVLEQKMANMMMNQNQYFLANTLSSISNTATLENAANTNQLILDLADYMKNSGNTPDSYITISDEMEQIERYIRLSCAKYEERFTYQIRIMEKMRNRKIPTHSILPYVQNAVYYGVALSGKESRLVVEGTLDNGIGIITISENGPGLSDEKLQEKFEIYHGNYEGKYIDRAMYHAKKRILTAFGEEYEPEIIIEPGIGRKFVIKVPATFMRGGFDDV